MQAHVTVIDGAPAAGVPDLVGEVDERFLKAATNGRAGPQGGHGPAGLCFNEFSGTHSQAVAARHKFVSDHESFIAHNRF